MTPSLLGASSLFTLQQKQTSNWSILLIETWVMGNYIMAVYEVLCIDIKHLYYIEWSTQMDDMAKIDILL